MASEFNLWNHFIGQSGLRSSFRDAFDRKTFILNQSPFQSEPVVSQALFDGGFRPKYPDGKEFGVCLSHDIDFLFLPGRTKLKESAKSLISRDIGKSLSEAASLTTRKIHSEFHIEHLINSESKYGANSSMYFLSLSKGETDFNYDPSEITDLFKLTIESGNEVGLHGGHSAYNNLEKLKKEKEKLEKAGNIKITGYRNHFLRFSDPLTWENLSAAGFDYDTTFAYPDCPGFRNGMCYPYRPFNTETGKFIDIVEVPLIIMDVNLTRLMRLTIDEGFEYCKSIIEKVKKVNGVITLLWHNSQDDMKDMQLYEKLLEYTHNEGGWLTSTQKMVDWWKKNNFIDEVEKALIQLQNER